MEPYVIPQPKSIEKSDETVFFMTDGVGIRFSDGCESAYSSLTGFLDRQFKIRPDGMGRGSIILTCDKTVLRPEGYTICVTYDNVTVTGHDSAGVFYGVQTLKQLLVSYRTQLPSMTVTDFPDTSWRGFMLDCSRYFYSKEDVFSFLDMMAFHKLNRFHWHLTDDQGWRIEMYSHLLLAQIGGHRAYTNFGKKPHGGFYSKDDIAEIIKYAHDRFITVIPEIDSPGHIVSAIAAYPELSCTERELAVATHTGVKHDVLCVGKESTFEFMFSVFDELCEMFPDKYVHIGGDEVPETRWKSCKHCQALMREKGFKSESELHSYYLNRIAEHLKSKGKTVIMWNAPNEIAYDKQTVFQYWDSDCERTRPHIESNSAHLYLDFPYGKTDLKKCYDYIPNASEKFMGAECCLWTEYVPDMKKAGYMLLPRMGAFSEKIWKNDENDFDFFLKKMPCYYSIVSKSPLKPAPLRHSLPNKIKGILTVAWFEKRRLHWQGLYNIIDDKKAEKLLKNIK